jgi:hypothetical protein
LNNETEVRCLNIFSEQVLQKNGFKDYKLAWSSDDRAIIDFSSGKPIFSTDARVCRMSDLNISGGKTIFKKNKRLAGTHDLLKVTAQNEYEANQTFIALMKT